MESKYIIELIIALVVSIIGYFLKRTMDKIDELEDRIETNKDNTIINKTTMAVIEVKTESKFVNLSDKIDMLFTSIGALTKEIKDLNKTISQK
jgi:Tfp pilus assembly protein PilO